MNVGKRVAAKVVNVINHGGNIYKYSYDDLFP